MYAGKPIHKLFMLVNNLTIFYKSKKTVQKITFEEKDLVLRDLGVVFFFYFPFYSLIYVLNILLRA